MKTAPILTSERLSYRDITESDTPLIVKWRSDPNVYQYFVFPHPLTKEEHLNWLRTSYAFDMNRFDWIASDKDDHPIGIFGVKKESSQSKDAEISYLLDAEQMGKGYATEAIGTLIRFCKNEWNTNTVTARIHKDNINSISFISKIGFQKTEVHGDFQIYAKNV